MENFKLVFKENGKEFDYNLTDETYEAAKARGEKLASEYGWELMHVYYAD